MADTSRKHPELSQIDTTAVRVFTVATIDACRQCIAGWPMNSPIGCRNIFGYTVSGSAAARCQLFAALNETGSKDADVPSYPSIPFI